MKEKKADHGYFIFLSYIHISQFTQQVNYRYLVLKPPSYKQALLLSPSPSSSSMRFLQPGFNHIVNQNITENALRWQW